jgi:hypothetical protein
VNAWRLSPRPAQNSANFPNQTNEKPAFRDGTVLATHHGMNMTKGNTMTQQIRADADGFLFKTPATEGWQDRVRAWAKRVGLKQGSELHLCRVDGGLCGKIHTSIIGA